MNFDDRRWRRPARTANARQARTATKLHDPMLLYFTSGTTGMPKMVMHNYSYAAGAYPHGRSIWHNVQTRKASTFRSRIRAGANAHGASSMDSGSAETTVFVYDFDKFVPPELLEVISKFKITTFCAPPTIYRYFIKEDLSKYDFSSL